MMTMDELDAIQQLFQDMKGIHQTCMDIQQGKFHNGFFLLDNYEETRQFLHNIQYNVGRMLTRIDASIGRHREDLNAMFVEDYRRHPLDYEKLKDWRKKTAMEIVFNLDSTADHIANPVYRERR